MPTVRGMLVEQAQVLLADMVEAVRVEPVFTTDVPLRLRVIAQSPEPGTPIDKTVEVTLVAAVEERS